MMLCVPYASRAQKFMSGGFEQTLCCVYSRLLCDAYSNQTKKKTGIHKHHKFTGQLQCVVDFSFFLLRRQNGHIIKV